MKRRRIKEPVTETERKLLAIRGKHERLVAAFLALRDVRSLTHSTEPALRIVRDRLVHLPETFTRKLHLKNPAPFRTKLSEEVKNIVNDMDAALIEVPDDPVAKHVARYLHANNQLKPGDLEVDES